MLSITTLTLGQLQTNCYLITDPETKKTLILDPADEGQYLISVITQKNLDPQAIVITHGHFDHLLASLEIHLTYKIPFVVPQPDEFLISKTQESARHWLGIDVDPPAPISHYLDHDIPLQIGPYQFEIISTPGHTPGSVCFYSQAEQILFSGDTLFAQGSVGRTDFSYSSPPKLHHSLTRLLQLPPEVIVYPGHGSTTDIRTERLFHQVDI